MNANRLLALYDRVADALDAIPRMRRFVLDLAVRGKLVDQDPADEPASELLKRVEKERNEHTKGRRTRTAQKTIGDIFEGPDLPQSWSWSTLGDISLRLHYGFTASADPKVDAVRLLRISDIQDDRVNWDRVPGCAIDEAALPNYALEVGDILIARTGGTIGKTFLVSDVPFESVFASYLIRVQPARTLLDRYVKMFCGSDIYWEQLRDGSRGGGQPNVNGQTLGKMKVSLPPLAEQHRIVAKVDELMGLCDRLEAARTAREVSRDRLTVTSLARLTSPGRDADTFRTHVRFALDELPALTARPDQIKSLRQAILNLAVRGKLVEQKASDEPASDLLKRIVAEKVRLGIKPAVVPVTEDEVPFALPDGWSWTRVGEICSKTGSGSTPRGGKAAYQNRGVPFLRSQNVYNDGLRLDDVAFIDQRTHARMSGTKVLPGDLLLNITGGSMGRCCRVPEDFEGANVSQHVAIIRAALEGMEVFLHHLVISPYFQAFIFDKQTGAGRGGLPKNRMDKIPIALPPLAEQHRIVAKANALMALCDRLEASLGEADTTRRDLLDALLREALHHEVSTLAAAALEAAG